MDETDDAGDAPAPTRERRRPWGLMLGVVVLTLLAIWLVPDKQAPSQPPLAAIQPAPTERPQLTLPTEPTAAGRAIDSDRPGDAARRLIDDFSAESDGSQRAFEAARRFSANGRDSDAYLLYFFAARNGHAEAALTLGRQSDPAFRDAEASFPSPDLAQAHKWYRMAEAAGSAEATQQLGDLRSRVEQIAAAGDAKAQRLMLQWR